MELLREWMEEVATECQENGCRQDIACWLTERPCFDDHPDTIAVGQFVLEARAFVKAWVSFYWKNPDFLLKNPDLLFRNPDFLLENVIL